MLDCCVVVFVMFAFFAKISFFFSFLLLKAGNNRAVINEAKGYIEYHFKIKDMGPVKTMLGMNIYHNVLMAYLPWINL